MLTEKHCKNATCPTEKKRARFTDGCGLYWEVSPAGSKRWIWKTYSDGKDGRLAMVNHWAKAANAAGQAGYQGLAEVEGAYFEVRPV